MSPDETTQPSEKTAGARLPPNTDEILVKVEGVSKKFCRDLKDSLWYGVKDVATELIGRQSDSNSLRSSEFWAVNDVSFDLRRGECLGLVGHNGAGKTTLLKMLNGLIKPDQGRIEMRGRVGALIALGAGFNPILTGRENIHVNGSVLGLSKREINAKLDQIIEFAEIGDFIDAPVQNYSSGMQVRLGFAVASALKPDILLLDEVLAVGDMKFQAKCLNTLGKMRKEGASFILVSHNMLNITRYCDRVIFMKNGKVGYLGSTAEGVLRYENDMKAMSTDAATNELTEVSATGSGRIFVQRIHFTNGEGAPCQSICSGDALRLWIDYKVNSADTMRVRVEVTIRDKSEILHQYTDEQVFETNIDNREYGCFSCHFPTLPANSTLLLFSVVLWSPDFSEMYDWKKRIPLHVQPTPKSTGRIHLPFVLRHSKSPDQEKIQEHDQTSNQ